MRENNILPPAIFSYAEARKQDVVLQAAKDFESEEEYIYYLTHEVNNVVHQDGRIYMQIDENGNLYANSVSPYSQNFLNNIEPKIRPLVESLINKRYLSYSSCEGHGASFRRYVGLAFADEYSRQYVVDFINGLNLPGVSLKLMDSVCNQKIDLKSKRNIKYTSKYNAQDIEQKESEVKTFNIQFHRNYENYCFLEIIILDEIKFDITILKNPFKAIWLYWMKKHKWDKLTQQLVNSFNSDEFKKYKF